MTKYLVAFLVLCMSFSAAAANSEVLKKTQSSWNNTPIKQMNLIDPEVTVVRIQIPKGEKLPLHQHPILNVGYLTKGELTVRSEKGDVLVLKPGDPIVELVNEWHYGESTGSEDAEIVVTYVGDKDDGLSVSKQ